MEHVNTDTQYIIGCAHAVKIVADAIPEPVLVLDRNRRLVYANNSAHSYFGEDSSRVGRLPGEIFGCSRAFSSKNHECGSGKLCKHCGANNAIMESLLEIKSTKECSILKEDGDTMELKVVSTPLVIDDKFLLFVYIKDISDNKRKIVLERLFFHDIMNLLSGINGITDIIESSSDIAEFKELIPLMQMSIVSMTDEIRSYKMVSEAENSELKVKPTTTSTFSLLKEIQSLYSVSDVCHGKHIVIDKKSVDITFETDKTIIKRVLGNLVKNALEASSKGESVTIGSYFNEKEVEFKVHNNSFIPEKIQAHLFHKNISTKGVGRGLGSHSVKLLSEKFLNGSVDFISSENGGTTFSVTYPLKL